MANDKDFSLKTEYYNLVLTGEKTVEGRINTGKFANMKVGDHILVTNTDDKKSQFILEITGRTEYKSFKEMLEDKTVDKVLPGCESIDQGVKIYYEIADYKEKEKLGVAAFDVIVKSKVT